MQGFRKQAKSAGIPLTTNHVGTMFGFFFTEIETVTQYQQVMTANTERFNQFFHLMLEAGVYFAPASYEAGFMSAAHTDEDIEQTIAAAANAFKQL